MRRRWPGAGERNPRPGAPGFRTLLGLVAAGAVLAGCGGDGVTGPDPAELTIAIQAGDNQFAPAGSRLPEPLQVVVTEIATRNPVEGVDVEWRVVEGTGARLDWERTETDSLGYASNGLTLGPEFGVYRVEATFRGYSGTPPVFTATAAPDPEITRLPEGPVGVGDTILIEGRYFSPIPDDNQVFFDGLRGTVLASTGTELTVVVPLCLPSRRVEVRIRLGSVESEPAYLDVEGGTERLDLAPGEGFVSSDPGALECVRLPALAGSEYVLIPHSAATAAGSTFPYRIRGLGEAAAVGAGVPRAGVAREPPPAPRGPGLLQARWEARLRIREGELLPAPPRAGPPAAPAAEPKVGDRRDFKVYNKDGGLDDVTGEVVHVSRHAVIYEDVKAPEGGLTADDYRRFGDLIDDPVYERDVEVFGTPSDVDGNGRIIVLFTPVVNTLTEREPCEDGKGFIAGFFYGLDLLDREGSNRAEIFYALVPDPRGEFSCKHDKNQVLHVLPPVLAHELQHMISFNQRILLRGASSTETLWLSEGLAHTAEDVVGTVFLERGDSATAAEFKVANYVRGFRFLKDPPAVSLVVTKGTGSLEERGAGWLFVKYLMEHYGDEEILRRLTQTTRTGVANVTSATGRSWSALFGEWTAALYMDDLDLPVDPRFTYPTFPLREILGQFQGGFPLRPPVYGFLDFTHGDTLAASSADYLLVRAGATLPRALNLHMGDAEGGPLPPEARGRISVFRIR